MKVLVTGGRGRVASEFIERTSGSGHHFVVTDLSQAGDVTSYDYVQLNITDDKQVRDTFLRLRPDVVFHLAAYTDVDGCEIHPDKAAKVNVEGTRNIAGICAELGLRLIFLSSDYVFDGISGPYSEDDQTSPINHYGATKLEGEEIISRTVTDHVILRINVPYGLRHAGVSHNFVTWLLGRLKKGHNVRIVSDQYANPTPLWSLADVLNMLVENELRGLLHFGGADILSRLEMAQLTAEAFGYDGSLIVGILTEELKQAARRPLKSGLRTDRIEKALGVKPVPFYDGLLRMKEGDS